MLDIHFIFNFKRKQKNNHKAVFLKGVFFFSINTIYATINRLLGVECFKILSQNTLLVVNLFFTVINPKRYTITYGCITTKELVDRHQSRSLVKGLFRVRRVPFICCYVTPSPTHNTIDWFLLLTYNIIN